jgi:hypothetical protein
MMKSLTVVRSAANTAVAQGSATMTAAIRRYIDPFIGARPNQQDSAASAGNLPPAFAARYNPRI